MSSRWNPLAGVVAVACMFAGFAIAGSSPDTQGPDAKITAYFASSSNQTKNIVALLLFAVGVLLLITFYAVLRERLAAAGGGLSSLVFGAGVASAVMWFSAVVFFTGPALAANDTSRFHLDPNLYRLTSDMGYAFWVGAVMTGAVVVFATCAAAAGALPRWFVRTGVVVGVLLLFAVFFIPAFIYWAWILATAVLLTRAPRAAIAPVVPQPA
jgi:hypothetical protein